MAARIRNSCGPLSRTRDECPWGLPRVPFALRRVGPLAESGKASQGIQAMTDGGRAALEVIRSAERQVLDPKDISSRFLDRARTVGVKERGVVLNGSCKSANVLKRDVALLRVFDGVVVRFPPRV
jgi:hypothetical protein